MIYNSKEICIYIDGREVKVVCTLYMLISKSVNCFYIRLLTKTGSISKYRDVLSLKKEETTTLFQQQTILLSKNGTLREKTAIR
jgi:hypothetical protein